MMRYSFTVGQKYKREHVSQQAGDGGDISGNWSTGYPQKNGVTFIFSNVGNPGQTGHDYDNYFDGPDLIWRGRTGSHQSHSSIQRMTTPGSEVHVFWRTGGRDPFTYGGIGRAVKVTDEVPVRIHWQLHDPNASQQTAVKTQRFPASEFDKLRPEHVWEAVQLLTAGYAEHLFALSTDYDVVTDDGHRLPPKAVFGIAAKLALGYEVGPAHFTAGVRSRCFRTIENAGYRIVPKNDQPAELPLLVPEDQYWTEGNKKLTSHMKRERSPAASRAKKSQFKALHGKLFCEKCGLVPVEHYGTAHAESCIEVHHRNVQVQEMAKNHRTTLDALQCLCANCHRLEHKILKAEGSKSS